MNIPECSAGFGIRQSVHELLLHFLEDLLLEILGDELRAWPLEESHLAHSGRLSLL